MDKIKLLSNLKHFGIEEKEGEIYLELLKTPYSNGSQIAKKLNYPRTTVYQNLQRLQEKGCILSIPHGDITTYMAVPPKELIYKLKKEINEATIALEKGLEEIETEETGNHFYNVNSFSGFLGRIQEMLKEAREEVYINTNFEPQELLHLEGYFKKLKKAGVRVVLFSFHQNNYRDLIDECYFRSSLEGKEQIKRFLIVTDMKMAFMGSGTKASFTGTYSENNLLINIIAEHIHNDIYLMKLERSYQGNFWQDIKIDTKQELENIDDRKHKKDS